MDLDLVGMHVTALREEAKFTVLTKPEGVWSNDETGKLAVGLITEVQSHPTKLQSIILWDEHSEEKIRNILGPTEFNYKVLAGFDNEELPWRPMF